MNKWLTSLCLLCSLITTTKLTGELQGGITSADGDEYWYWHNHALILARVDGVRIEDPHRQCYLTLDPKLTLAGTFDCVRESKVVCDFPYGMFGSPLLSPPKEGSLVLLVISPRMGGYLASGSYLGFMPKQLPAFAVDGIHDSASRRTIEIVSERRRLSEAEAERREFYDRESMRTFDRDAFPQSANSDPEWWTEHSAVYAEVLSKAVNEDKTAARVNLRLLGTLTGSLDAALVKEITLDVAESKQSLGNTKLFDVQETVFVSLGVENGKLVLSKPPGKSPFAESPLLPCSKPTDDARDKLLRALRTEFDSRPFRSLKFQLEPRYTGPKQKPLYRFHAHSKAILRFQPDSKLRLVEEEFSHRLSPDLEFQSKGSVTELLNTAIGPDSKTIAAAYANDDRQLVDVWNSVSGRRVARYEPPAGAGQIQRIWFSDDGGKLKIYAGPFPGK